MSKEYNCYQSTQLWLPTPYLWYTNTSKDLLPRCAGIAISRKPFHRSTVSTHEDVRFLEHKPTSTVMLGILHQRGSNNASYLPRVAIIPLFALPGLLSFTLLVEPVADLGIFTTIRITTAPDQEAELQGFLAETEQTIVNAQLIFRVLAGTILLFFAVATRGSSTVRQPFLRSICQRMLHI